MAGNEILMGDGSSLGPIDGQVVIDSGKSFSADAFLEGFKKIKREAEEARKLNPTYIPILQNTSLGEIQKYENVQNFSKRLVTDWLAKHMFKHWDRHQDGKAVTDDRRSKAERIAEDPGSQSKWLTHARSIKMVDLEKIGIGITNYSKNTPLNVAIARYYTLLRMSFESTSTYKIFETKDSHICWHVMPFAPSPPQFPSPPPSMSSVMADIECAGWVLVR